MRPNQPGVRSPVAHTPMIDNVFFFIFIIIQIETISLLSSRHIVSAAPGESVLAFTISVVLMLDHSAIDQQTKRIVSSTDWACMLFNTHV